MTSATRFRGQPLLLLAGVLSAWFGLRVALWQPDAATEVRHGGGTRPHQHVRRAVLAGHRLANAPTDAVGRSLAIISARAAWSARPSSRAIQRVRSAELSFRAFRPAARFVVAETDTRPVRLTLGHSLLLAAGVSQLELPPILADYVRNAEPLRPGVPAAAPQIDGLLHGRSPSTVSRLSADAWLALRLETTASVASGRASYGRSQAGGVMRYALAPSRAHGAQAYVRVSSALGGALERDLAVGISARPLSRVPVRLAAEARLTETGIGTELRPAVFAQADMSTVSVPRKIRTEAYLQGGYVGGRFATGFVDGQARVERRLARFGNSEVGAGAGVWGGAQKGAARLDAGPTAAIAFRVGRTRGRVAADYRFRLAGNAEPSSGPALTLSAGF